MVQEPNYRNERGQSPTLAASWDQYQDARVLNSQHSFIALLMAAMKHADDANLAKLKEAFPDVYAEIVRRETGPSIFLAGEWVEGRQVLRDNGWPTGQAL